MIRPKSLRLSTKTSIRGDVAGEGRGRGGFDSQRAPPRARGWLLGTLGEELRTGWSRPPLSAMPVEYLTPTVEDRAVEVQGLLADQERNRAPSVSDLLVAATAELAGLTVLHVDKDFELIADVTGQPVEHLDAI